MENENSMKNKRLLYTPLIAMLVLSMAMVNASGYVPPGPPATWIYVDPDPKTFFTIENLTCTEFNVSVNIHDVTNLYGYEFKLGFNTTLLNATAVYPGPVNTAAGIWKLLPQQEIGGEYVWTPLEHVAEGYVHAGCVFINPWSGSGTLMTITFHILMAPPREPVSVPENRTVSCALDLYDTVLGDPVGGTIPHGVDDGFYEYIRPQIVAGDPPVAIFTWEPATPLVDEMVTFNASDSYDPDGSIVSYDWSFGDNTAGTGESTTHAYTAPGTYVVTLTVTDDTDLSSTAQDIIQVIEVVILPEGANLVKKSAWPERHHFDVSAELGKGRDDINTLYALVRNLNEVNSTDVKVVFTVYRAADMYQLGTINATGTLTPGPPDIRLEVSFDTKDPTWQYMGTKIVYKVSTTAFYLDGTDWVQIEGPKVKWLRFSVQP